MNKKNRVILSGLFAAILGTIINFTTSDKTTIFIGNIIIVTVSVLVFSERKNRVNN